MLVVALSPCRPSLAFLTLFVPVGGYSFIHLACAYAFSAWFCIFVNRLLNEVMARVAEPYATPRLRQRNCTLSFCLCCEMTKRADLKVCHANNLLPSKLLSGLLWHGVMG